LVYRTTFLANTHNALSSNDLFVVVSHPYFSISLEINSSVTFYLPGLLHHSLNTPSPVAKVSAYLVQGAPLLTRDKTDLPSENCCTLTSLRIRRNC